VLVGSGIFLSRISGLIRDRVFAHYFGICDAADAFRAALRIPNLLQNLFGEGALSSSFIPVYANLLAAGKKEEADKIARVIGSILVLAMSLLVLIGVLSAPFLGNLLTSGYTGEKRVATIQMVQIMFPGMGVLVISAWCLGILNSHRRFFLPYAASVLWNLAMITALMGYGGKAQPYPLAKIMAWGSVAGSILQFGVQLPSVIRLVGSIHFQIDLISSNVRTVLKNFIPGLTSRGVNQLSSYIDLFLAGYLQTGALTNLFFAQQIYLIPIGLFGMSITNAELPEMASELGSKETIAEALCRRLNSAIPRVAFFIIPSAAAFLALGDSIVALIYQTGKFARADVPYVWAVLAGSAVGLLASSLGRLYTSAFWAMRDTRTPLRFATIRVVLTAGLGWLLAFPVPRWLGLPVPVGLIGLTVSAGMAAWLEFTLLRITMNRRIGKTGLQAPFVAKLWGTAIVAAGLAIAVKYWTRGFHPLIASPIVLLVFGTIYFSGTAALRIPEAMQLFQAVSSRLRSRS
jgi:putative peptidoglycan lipid II flippase